MENPQQSVPMEELAQVVFQKDIQIATLLKQLKEANNQIKTQAELLGQMGTAVENKETDVKDNKVRVQADKQ